jgi:predicted ester cyclase
VLRWAARGAHRGEYMGIAATGKQAAITGTVIDRILDGQLQEEWENWDALGLMQQLLHWGRPLGNCYPNRESCQARLTN